MWTPWYIVAFIFGIIAIALNLLNFVFTSRIKILIIRIIFDFIIVFEEIAVFIASGENQIIALFVVDAFGLIRELTFFMKDKWKWVKHWLTLAVFEVILGCSLIFTWRGPISLMPTFAAMLLTFGLYVTDQRISKVSIMLCSILFSIYDAILIPNSNFLTILNLICSLCGLISATIGLVVLYKKNKNKNETDLNQSH